GLITGGSDEGEITAVSPTPNIASNPTIPAQVGDSGPAAPTPKPTWTPPVEVQITPNEEFYTLKYNPSPPPDVDLETYRLVIEGEVDTPLSLSIEEIRNFPSYTQMRTLQCISNPVGGNLIGNAIWTGVAMRELLEAAGIRPSGKYLRLECLDGYHTGIPVSLAMDENSLLVYEMNGEILPADHGFPLRALWPGRYGQKQPKWLTRIVVQRQPHVGHWEGQGWSDEARIQPTSIIWQPPEQEKQPPDYYVAGIAFSTDVGLEKVEVSLDNGNTWQEAELLRGPSPLTWTHWWLKVEGAEPGVYRVLARATDNNGKSQRRAKRGLGLLDDTFPNGTDAMHEIAVQVSGNS
ncbi:MAG: hypothetical protein D6706_11180, partial [Chloroflexi bacterium]